MYVLFKKELARSWLLAYRHRSYILNALFFFIIIVSLFPLALSPSDTLLKLMAPAVIWVAILLAHLLSFSQLFVNDYLDGSLDQYLLNPEPLSVLIFFKILFHWLMLMIPVMLVIPCIALMYHLAWHTTLILLATLLLGTPTLVYLGAIMAALTVSLRSNGLLLGLLLLPLYVPVLVFATMAVTAAEKGVSASAELAILMAMLLLTLVLAPVVVSSALRIGCGCQSH